MVNGLPRRRHRTNSGSLRDSPEDDGPLELQEPARLRDRPVKKDRDREMRDRDRDHRDRERDRERERERDRLSRSKRRRGDKYMHGSNREDGGGGGDDSSEESVNDEDEEDDDGPGPVRYVPPSNHPVQMTSSSPASSLTSHRKTYPPPTKIFRQSVAPTWKAPDEMMGVSVPRKARSASTKRSQDSWGAGGGGVVVSGEQIHRQASASPVRSTMTASATAPSPSPAPMSPSSSNVSIKKKIKPNGPTKQKPPKSCLKSSSSPPIQDDIEIEVAEVLYGLKRQSQAPSSLMQEITAVSNDSAKFDSNRSAGDSKSRVSSPISAPLQPSPAPPQNSSSSASPLITVAPKRKRPRPYPDENPVGFGARSRPISPTPKMEADQALKMEAPTSEKNLVGSAMENGDVANSNDPTSDSTPPVTAADGAVQDAKPPVVLVANGTVADAKEDSGGKDGVVMRAKVEEASSSPKMESQDQNRVESTSTSTKPKSAVVEKENRREDKFEIDLMASPSPEREGEGEYGGGAAAIMGDEKPMVTDGQTEAKPNGEEDEKGVKLNASEAEPETKPKPKAKAKPNAKPVASESESLGEPHKEPPPCEQQQQLNLSCKERNIDLQLDLDKANRSTPTNEHKLDLQQQQQQLQKQPPPKIAKDEPTADKNGSSSVPLPMSVAAGWHGGLGPMGYVAPLHGVVSMDATSMASPPIQGPHFVFSPPKPKRCATHCYIARSVSVHQQMMKMNPYWPAAAAGTAPLFGAKPYNLNMVPPPPDLHAAAAAAAAGGRGGVSNSAQDKAQPFTLFPAQPSSKDKSPLSANASDANAQKKQFLLPQSLPPGAPSNMLHAPAFFFPFGQQQAAAAAAAAAASARPSSTKSPSTGGSAASTTMTSTSPIGASSAAMAAGPAMSFSYPNMGGNETQFMAILGNGAYPFPVPAHVGAAPPYRGSHPQAMSFFNGSFYSSQMIHPSQLQQQQSAAPQPMQIQQQNHQNPSISTASSSSQKHMQQNQQQRPQGGAGTAGAGSSNPSWQNFPAVKGRPHHDTGGEDSPSTADSRTRPNLSVYGQNFAMPFHSPNFALMTPPSSMAGSGNNSSACGPNGSGHSDKKQQQQQQPPQQQGLKAGIESLAPGFPMSFASMNGAAAPGLDISSMAQNHAILQSLPEAARHNYQIMAAAAAQAAQAAHQKKNNYRGPEDGKSGGGSSADASNVEEERKAMSSRASGASVGQSIAFSRDLAETAISTVPGGSVVDSSARSLNLIPGGSARPARPSGPNAGTNSSNASNSQQQQSQMLFTKQQQYVAATVAAARSKTPATSNGTVYPDHLTSSVIGGKFPNALGSFPPLVQSGGTSVQSPQWKNSARPNTSQVSSPSLASATSTAPNNKNLPQQQGRPQQNHTQISFGAAATANPKPPSSQGQQTQNSHQAPSPPMMVGSPSTSSISKSAGGSPRTATSTSTSNKAGAQPSTLSTQQGKNSQSPSLSSQKPSILGSPHIIQSSIAGGKPQLHDSQQQPQLSKQSIHQAQLFFSSAYMHPSGNPSAAASAGSGYYLQRHRPENQQAQQQQQGPKSQGSGTTPTSSSGMLSIGAPGSLANASTSDPAKAVAAAAAAANSMKGLPPQGIFHAAQFAQSAGGTHQLVPAGFSYVHAVPAAVQVKPAEQKQPAGE